MALHNGTQEDPIIAALPPATDYMTYLTLLEYNLTPQNLPTLNRLLEADDGQLVDNIGWDLMSIVLPMLSTAPANANRCLETISRRANPREVVIQVAGELEKLGRGATDDNDGDEDDEEVDDFEDVQGEDELRTFEGEATRIHLGRIRLDGMPQAGNRLEEEPNDSEYGSRETGADAGKDDAQKLEALLNMLSTLHPRIKTQHPSRFLATSLQAALGAYRRIPITASTTVAFQKFLATQDDTHSIGSGPRLPPRSDASVNGQPHVNGSGANDPPSSHDKAISNRLLQAVLLEVLEEYTNSLQTHEVPYLAWTARLREMLEPRRVMPGRPTEGHRWFVQDALSARDKIMKTFVTISDDMGLPQSYLLKVCKSIDEDGTYHPSSNAEEPETEYPTSPEQVPLSPAALIILHANSLFAQVSNETGQRPSENQALSTVDISRLLNSSYSMQGILATSSTPVPTPVLNDAILSLLYPRSTETSPASATSLPPSSFATLLSTLVEVFTTDPHPQIRDNAHHIATGLLHTHPDASLRLSTIKEILANPPIPSIHSGTVKAIAVDWLKDEFVAHIQHTPTPTETNNDNNDNNDNINDNNNNRPGLDPSLLSTDTVLLTHLFPAIPPLPSTTSPSSEDTEELLLLLPTHISAINLLCILLTQDTASRSTTIPHATSLLQTLTPWCRLLLDLAGRAAAEESSELRAGMGEIFALDDALSRLDGVLARVGGHP